MMHDSKNSCATPSMASGYKVMSFGQVCADQMQRCLQLSHCQDDLVGTACPVVEQAK